jgi:hypothetical protein
VSWPDSSGLLKPDEPGHDKPLFLPALLHLLHSIEIITLPKTQRLTPLGSP